jgi:TIR domain
VDTFKIPYTGRINAAGRDALREAAQAAHKQSAMGRESSPEADAWDVFISHASEDKDDFVRPLADRLRLAGLRVWFDEFTLTVGDSLRRSIDRGLARSRFGIVVISPRFLEKEWPQRELDGLVAREVGGVIKVILPVWHNIGAEEIRRYSLMLADRFAVSSNKGLAYVTSKIIEAIGKGDPKWPEIPTPSDNENPTRFQELRRYASEFHRRRSELIAAGKPRIDLLDGGAFIFHLVPLSAVNEQPVESFERVTREPHYFPPAGTTHGLDFKITYDGLLVGSNAEGLIKPQRAYVHVSRSGIIEAAVSSLARGQEYRFVVLPEIQAILIKFACIYAKSLDHFGIRPPIAIDTSLINVDGMELLQDFVGTALPEDLPSGHLDRPLLSFGQVLFEIIPRDYNECAKILRPILVHLANSAGLHSPPYFDHNGNYIGNLR